MPAGGGDATDVLLLPFLRAEDAESDRHLADLITDQTDATIKGIVRRRLRVSLSLSDGQHENQEALELVADIQADVLAALRRLRSGSALSPVGNLQSYVAAAAFNACHQLLRRKYPQRQRLRNKLRYMLSRVPQFALWQGDEWEWHCGLASWRTDPQAAMTAGQLETLRRGLQVPNLARHGDPSRIEFIELLTNIFGSAGRPLLMEDLVSLVADILGISDRRATVRVGLEHDQAESDEGGRVEATALIALEQRSGLAALWSAIRQLPARHRAALLLNLRDKNGGDAIALLPATGIATVDEIAAVLEFPPEEFRRVWNDLPWDDLAIARHLGLSRQQVINLRQSARARLAREWKDVR